MTAKYFALLTNQGAAKLANATALGTQLSLTQMAVGDGGGVLPTPDPAQTTLIGEKRRASLNSLSVDPANTNQIIAEQIIPEDQGGFWIREIGLFDQDNTLIAIANCPETYKPQLQEGSGRTQTVRMIIVVNSTDAVTLKIDPSVVLATRKYVDDKVIEVKAYTDDQLAKHVAAANPHNQYLQISKSLAEIKALGPDAVSAVLSNLGLGDDKFQGRLLNTIKFTKNSSYVPTVGARLIKVYVTGGGGGGGGVVSTGGEQGAIGSGGGGAGTAISHLIISELILPIAVTVGAGGMGGDGNQEPLSGINSSFGTYLSASGGARAANGLIFNFGETRIVSNGGAGAGINGNFLNLRGQPGTPALTFATGYESGGGGSSYFSSGGDPIASGVSVSGQNGVLGGGGGGAFNVPNSPRNTGGNGGGGIVIVEEYT